ncbi:hypothetical protein ACOME3_002361 [Neoechinorhynchus agilis]
MRFNLIIFFPACALATIFPLRISARDDVRRLDRSFSSDVDRSVSERLGCILEAMIPGSQVFIDGTLPIKPDYSLPISFNVYVVRGNHVDMVRIQGFFDRDRQLEITGVQVIKHISDFGIMPFPINV